MSPFIESIRYIDGQMPLFKWHQRRFVHTQQANWHQIRYPDLRASINQQIALQTLTMPALQQGQVYKCRVSYAPESIKVAFIPYNLRKIDRLLIRRGDHIQYPFKSQDRSALDELKLGLPTETEILILKNGLLTDSSFSNLAFYDEEHWYTPASPLLPGVHRLKLMEEGRIREADISLTDFPRFTKIKLINAMVSWEDSWELSTKAIDLF